MTWKECADCGSKRRAVVFPGGGNTCRRPSPGLLLARLDFMDSDE